MPKFKEKDTVAMVDDNGWAVLGTILEYDPDERVYVIYGKRVTNGRVHDDYGTIEVPALYLKKYDGKPEQLEKFLAKGLEAYRRNKEIDVKLNVIIHVKGAVGSDGPLLERAVKKEIARIYGDRAKGVDIRIN